MELDLENYSYEKRAPTTINQCLNELMQGYADADVYKELGKHFMELMADEFFLQWPLVRYKYASNLLYGYFDGRYEDNYIEGDEDLAIKILLPMAEAGLATAQYDVGRYYEFAKQDLDLALEWIVRASKQEYHYAHKYLRSLWYSSFYEKLSISSQKIFFSELTRIYDGWGLGDWAKEKLSKL